jgi:AcrR family transcriptional regulator
LKGAASVTSAAQATRRRDILDAASSLLDECSWADFTIRDVAARVGVSAGAVYQYFDTKQEIYAALYEERLAEQSAAVEALSPDLDLNQLLLRLVEDMAQIYAHLGRHQLAWAASGLQLTPSTQRLATTFRSLAASVQGAIGTAAAREGRHLAKGSAFLPFFWAVCNGVGDQLVDDRYQLHGAKRGEFLRFSADALARALTVSP